jgi:hypothetical protein
MWPCGSRTVIIVEPGSIRTEYFSRLGVGAKTPDNSAIFLGVRSSRPNIAKVVFYSSEPNRAIGIGTLRIGTVPTHYRGCPSIQSGDRHRCHRE